MDFDFSTFSNNLRLLLESRGMTAQSFAEEVGIRAASISRYLGGKREPVTSNVITIAEYFGVSVDWLLGVNGEKFDVLPQNIQDVVFLYSLASEDDRRVIQAVLSKYRRVNKNE